ncbi:transcription factor Opi1-domain-containing protein [Xylariaceae sp. FL0016]|nr:transcription factor Opi1-domain-containing protein [Xylariaceae sp. FL0016]
MEQHNHMPLPSRTHDHKHAPSLLEPPTATAEPRQTLTPSDPTIGMFDRLDRPFKLPLYPPPSYTQARDTFPDHKTELPPLKLVGALRKDDSKKNVDSLPSLSSVTATSSAPLYQQQSQRPPEPSYPPPAPPQPTHWPSLNPLTAYYNPSHVQSADPPLRMDVDATSNSGASAASPDRLQDGRASSVSLDDPDVRMAAEALGDLRADFVSSPPNRHTPLPGSPHSQGHGPHPEPLFSLLTTSHPLLATTIEGATSAYNSSKNYSPRFKTSAEYVEGYVIPIANTVGSVGRVTGVEGGVRWFLTRRQSHGADLEAGEQGSNKRRKVDSSGSHYRNPSPELESGAQTPRASMDNSHSRRLSVASTIDTLPAYDELRAPPYAEHHGTEGRPGSAAWQSRLIMSTSGLSIAMSEESLRSLKYCLGWLRWANVRIGNVINSLKTTMDKYEKTDSPDGDHPMQGSSSHSEPLDRRQLAQKIGMLKGEVLKTLHDVINTVSRYAGGALPENARDLVRRHLTSLPQRFRVASMAESDSQQGERRAEGSAEEGLEAHEKETRENAQRVILLAKEGLDMMAQVSGILDGTIVSAEEWCERLGRKRREQREDLLGLPHVPLILEEDPKMG